MHRPVQPSIVDTVCATELLATVRRLDAQYLYWLGEARKQEERALKAEAQVKRLREQLEAGAVLAE